MADVSKDVSAYAYENRKNKPKLWRLLLLSDPKYQPFVINGVWATEWPSYNAPRIIPYNLLLTPKARKFI